MSISNALKKVLTNKKLSADITFRAVSSGSYNTTTGVITESNTDTSIRGVLEDINNREVNELIEATEIDPIIESAVGKLSLKKSLIPTCDIGVNPSFDNLNTAPLCLSVK